MHNKLKPGEENERMFKPDKVAYVKQSTRCLIFPTNVRNVHWCLYIVVVEKNNKMLNIYFIDPLYNCYDDAIKSGMEKICKVWCKQDNFTDFKFAFNLIKPKHQQKDRVSCGYFTISYISDFLNNRMVGSLQLMLFK
jgi:Ulp1 family protease